MPARRMIVSAPCEPTTNSGAARPTKSTDDAKQLFGSQQTDAPRDIGNQNANKLVWFLVPSWNVCGGGVMSICHFYAETRMALSGSDVAVVASTYPNATTLKKYTAFPNSMDIFSFAEIVS